MWIPTFGRGTRGQAVVKDLNLSWKRSAEGDSESIVIVPGVVSGSVEAVRPA